MLAESAVNISKEVQALGARQTETMYKEGSKLISMTESIQTDLVAGCKLKNQVIFSRNIQLLFRSSKES